MSYRPGTVVSTLHTQSPLGPQEGRQACDLPGTGEKPRHEEVDY